MEFLLEIVVHLTPDLNAASREDLMAREHRAARALIETGQLSRIWRIPGKQGNWSIWNVTDATALHACVSRLPMFPWMTIAVHPLAEHPLSATPRISSDQETAR